MAAEALKQSESEPDGAEASRPVPKGILALDIDGTLTGPDGDIGERTQQAVHAAGESGWLVTIATGRSWAGTKPVADQLALRVPLVTFNGALIRDSVTAEILHYIPLSPEIVGSVVPALVDLGLQPLVIEDICEGERLFTGPAEYDGEYTSAWLEHFRYVDVQIERLSYEQLARIGHAVRITVVSETGHVRQIEDLARGREAEFRTLYYTELDDETGIVQILHPSSTKADALRWLARQYDLTMADVVAVGDGVNDLEMLAEAGFGVAMGNATERVQAEAEITIGHHMDEGLAHFIEERLLHVSGVSELNRLVG
ncbi:sugar-phosphatase [soil metagenome]